MNTRSDQHATSSPSSRGPRITRTTARLINISVETRRSDAVQSFLSQETIICEVESEDGHTGVGYSYTIGTGGSSVLAMLNDHLLGVVVGADSSRLEACWFDMFSATRATTVGPITSLALAAVDIALWDLACHRAGLPLWRLAGGASNGRPVYDTEGGWLHLGTDELAEGARAAVKRGLAGSRSRSASRRCATSSIESQRSARHWASTPRCSSTRISR